MRAYQSRKRATMVAIPRKTKTVILAEERPVDFFGIAGELTVGIGPALGEVMLAGALKRNVYEPVTGASVALKSV